MAELESVDRDALDADGLIDVVVARARLLWRVQGELFADLARLVAATPPEEGQDVDAVIGDVGDWVAWSLHCSRAYAAGQVDEGVQLATRLPMVLDALRAGEIDAAKAGAFVEALRHVADEIAAAIATRLVVKARRWTLAQLRASLRYHVDRRDPGAARRRYTKRVADRDVWLRAQPDGTANLSGQGLAPHRAAAAYDRIDRLARAARAQGDVRNLSQLRADALCDVLAGVPFRLAATVDPLSAAADAAAPPDLTTAWAWPQWRPQSRFITGKTDEGGASGGHGCGGVESGGVGTGGDGTGGDGTGGDGTGGDGTGGDGGHGCGGVETAGWPQEPPGEPPADVIDLYDYDRACLTDQDRAWAQIGCEPPGAADEEPPWWPGRPAPDSRPPGTSTDGVGGGGDSCSGNANPGRWDWDDAEWAAAQAEFLATDAVLSGDVLAGDRCAACGGRLAVRPGVVDVQIKLTTLAGLDEHPGLIPGFGITLAPIARSVAFDAHTRPVWRWSIFDADGALRHHGITQHRPPAPEQSRSESGKTPGTCRCARVEQAQRRGSVEIQLTMQTLAEWGQNPVSGYETIIADIQAQVEADRSADRPSSGGRMPDAVEEAFIRARDRSCRSPQCQVIAARTELDHRVPYAQGGPSHRGNVDCRCKRHHHLRDRRGYRITKIGRTTLWSLPSGRSFSVDNDKDIILAVEQ